MTVEDKAVVERLREECETIRSRVEAILSCESAIAFLESPDVFGRHFGELLFSDVRALTEAVRIADHALKAPSA